MLGTTSSIGLPWTGIKEGTSDVYVGVEPELAAEIAKRLGLKLEVNNLGFDSLIPSLEANRINIIMSDMLTRRCARRRLISSTTIMGGSAMMQKSGGDKKIAALDDICGLKASALRGSMESFVDRQAIGKVRRRRQPAVEAQLFRTPARRSRRLTAAAPMWR